MLLEVDAIHSGYGKVTILHDVSLQVDRGEIVVILGANGVGKTTLMRALAGHLPITKGQIILNGQSIGSRGPYAASMAGLGYMPQENNIFSALSVIDNLRVPTLFRPEFDPRVDQALERFPILKERRNQRSSTLSGGEQQMLAISSAMIDDPDLILLDELTAGLAPIFVDLIIEWLVETAAMGKGVIWVVEQKPEPILKVSGRTYIMEGGQITGEVPSANLLDPAVLKAAILDDSHTLDAVIASKRKEKENTEYS